MNVSNYKIFFNFLIVCFLGIALNVSAQMRPNHEGYFDVRSATTILVEDNYMLDSRLQLFLSNEALNALNSGVPLTIELNVEIIRSRRFLPDAKESELEFQFELEYRPLSQRYIVKNVQDETQDSYATLFSALNKLGRVQNLFLMKNSSLEPRSNYRLRLQALLSTKQYSAPLRMLFFWRDQWDLKSEWYEWQLQR
ncbi:MAG: hypothetical protein CMP00_01590 [Woeseiaceae bacterium]|jgi:hypothetical protein|nr:hypothetical protein [Woeseiaceae bacterium]MDG1713562.1 DUF4390 domain-containing protein [Woeseiaceae bacterium]|tara:strand:+ start:74 stop:661 length:588 start_codon:yes stop_codon:yes gene_type:complete